MRKIRAAGRLLSQIEIIWALGETSPQTAFQELDAGWQVSETHFGGDCLSAFPCEYECEQEPASHRERTECFRDRKLRLTEVPRAGFLQYLGQCG